jgi:hypothetical protein
MIQGREARASRSKRCFESGSQDLMIPAIPDRDRALNLVSRARYYAPPHATRAERGENFIRPEFGACRQGHTTRHYSPGEKRHSRGPMTRCLLELVTLGTRLEPQRGNSRLVGNPYFGITSCLPVIQK